MPSRSNEPFAAAEDAARNIVDQVIPRAKDRFAQAAPKPPRLSIDRLARLPDAEAEAMIQAAIAQHGARAVEEHIRRQVGARLKRRGSL
jgi:hypothetical protein